MVTALIDPICVARDPSTQKPIPLQVIIRSWHRERVALRHALTLVLKETVFLRPVATRTLCQADLQESETFGPGSSYNLGEEVPV